MKYTIPGKFRLEEDESIYVPWLRGYNIDLPYISLLNGKLTGKAGYCSDGPSPPAIQTKNFLRGALFHDILYQLIRLELIPRKLRVKADKLLYSICVNDGMWRIRAAWVYTAVKTFARKAAHPDAKRRVYTAP